MREISKKILAITLASVVSIGGISAFAISNAEKSNQTVNASNTDVSSSATQKTERQGNGGGNNSQKQKNGNSGNQNSGQNDKKNLTEPEIEKIALSQVENGKIMSMKQKHKRNRSVYKYEISDGKNIHEVKIDGNTGKVLEKECDYEELDPDGADVKIKKAEAESIAKKELANGTITEIKLEKKRRCLVYEIKMEDNKTEKEIKIDAETGRIIKKEIENND